MSSIGKIVFLGAFLAVAAFQAAHAADVPVVEVGYGPPPYYSESGWYLRGDIGYVVAEDPVVTYGGGAVSFLNESLGTTWMIGGGIGYRYNSWFRTDLTFDYRAFDFTGNTPCGCPGDSVETYDLDTWTIMVNAYADLGSWYGITPYVGAGVGAAYHWLHDIVGVNPDASVTIIPDGGGWAFAAAVMAGVTIAVSDRTSIDAGYRYIWLGDVESGQDGSGGTVLFEDMAEHEIRVGLRVEI
jgi:opacity protein-like surface antigen